MIKVIRNTTLGLCVAMGLFGCGDPERVEIRQAVPVSNYERPVPQSLPDGERFRLASSVAPPTSKLDPAVGKDEKAAHAGHAGHSSAPKLTFTRPEAWQEVPATQFRRPNFTAGAVECYVTVLPGLGGGLLQNANRWRGQMGAAPLSPGDFDRMPTKPILRTEGSYLEIEGAFAGMGASAPRSGYKMLGVLAEHRGYGIYVKMIGPADAVDAQRAAFDVFLASLGTTGPASLSPHNSPSLLATANGALPAGHPPVGGKSALASKLNPEGTGGGAQGLRWQAPDGWEDGGARSMRLVTYNPEGADDTECYVTLLSGTAGGLLNNVNRWRGQFGSPPVTEAEIQSLPTVSFLGNKAPLIEVQGPYTDMNGQVAKNQAMFAMAWIEEERSAFIKMTGPADTLSRQKESFVAFCQSFGWAI